MQNVKIEFPKTHIVGCRFVYNKDEGFAAMLKQFQDLGGTFND